MTSLSLSVTNPPSPSSAGSDDSPVSSKYTWVNSGGEEESFESFLENYNALFNTTISHDSSKVSVEDSHWVVRGLKNIGRSFFKAAFKGFEGNQNARPLKAHRFLPWTNFKKEVGCEYLMSSGESGVVPYRRLDMASLEKNELAPNSINALPSLRDKELYVNDSDLVKMGKNAGLLVITPIFHPIGLILVTLNSLVKVLFGIFLLGVLWHPSYKASELGKDILRLGSILLLPLLIASAFYGLITPHTGGKNYAAYESLAYGEALLAPCFQPNPTHHLFGGDIHKDNQL